MFFWVCKGNMLYVIYMLYVVYMFNYLQEFNVIVKLFDIIYLSKRVSLSLFHTL